jgi:hypothetical protein
MIAALALLLPASYLLGRFPVLGAISLVLATTFLIERIKSVNIDPLPFTSFLLLSVILIVFGASLESMRASGLFTGRSIGYVGNFASPLVSIVFASLAVAIVWHGSRVFLGVISVVLLHWLQQVIYSSSFSGGIVLSCEQFWRVIAWTCGSLAIAVFLKPFARFGHKGVVGPLSLADYVLLCTSVSAVATSITEDFLADSTVALGLVYGCIGVTVAYLTISRTLLLGLVAFLITAGIMIWLCDYFWCSVHDTPWDFSPFVFDHSREVSLLAIVLLVPASITMLRCVSTWRTRCRMQAQSRRTH